MRYNHFTTLFSSFNLNKLTLATRIIHSAISDAIPIKDYLPFESRYVTLVENKISLTTLSLKKAFQDPSTNNTRALLKQIVKSVHNKGGNIFFQADPSDNEHKSIIPYIDAALFADFDGLEFKLKGHYFKDSFQGILRGDTKSIEDFKNKFSLIRDHIGSAMPVIFKIIVPITIKGINTLNRISIFFTENRELMPAALHVSMGMKKNNFIKISGKNVTLHEDAIHYFNTVKSIRHQLSLPIILGGGITSPVVMEKFITDEICDLIALGRPLIREPDILPLIQQGKRKKFVCSLCNGCKNDLPEPIICPKKHSGC